ncbi:MAG TPA: hypothetical protein V6D07_07855 [Trichocoleus sp.]
MVATVEQIQKELSAIEAATATMAENFKDLYKNYLKALSQAARRQLILASYYLCTQAYPDAFLRLSVGQRQKLQQDLRGLGDDLRNRLLTLLEAGPEGWQNTLLISDSPPSLLAASKDPDGEKSSGEVADSIEELGDEQEQNTDTDTAIESKQEASEAESGEGEASREVALSELPFVQAMLMNAMLEAMDPDMAADADTDQPLTPSRLAKRHFFIEQRVRVTLRRISSLANRLLQKMEILPDLPEAILAAATDADIPLEKTASAPNLLNVLVEIARDGQRLVKEPQDSDPGSTVEIEEEEEDEEDEEDRDEDEDEEDREDEGDEDSRNATHLVAIHLRLSDIEFADPQSSLWRSKLREALGKLKQLGRQYQKKQEERAIAEAELAWRSIWYDDVPKDEPSERG